MYVCKHTISFNSKELSDTENKCNLKEKNITFFLKRVLSWFWEWIYKSTGNFPIQLLINKFDVGSTLD